MEYFPCSLNRFEYTLLIRAIHLKRSHVQVLHLNHVQLSSCTNFCIRRFVLLGFFAIHELKYKVLKYYVVVKLSHHKVPTNRVSVAL